MVAGNIYITVMKEFDYNLDYMSIRCLDQMIVDIVLVNEQGVLLVRPYTENICHPLEI